MFKSVPMLSDDTPTFCGRLYATTPKDLKGADVAVVGVPYIGGWAGAGPETWTEWRSAPKEVRKESAAYAGGYVMGLNVNVFEHLKVVDYGDAEIVEGVFENPTAENILKTQRNVERKVGEILDAGCMPIAIGGFSPCTSYAVVKSIAERIKGKVGVISLDAHLDFQEIDTLTMDPRIAGGASWKTKMFEFHKNVDPKNLVEIGERGICNKNVERIDTFRKLGVHWYPAWKVKEMGIEKLSEELRYAYDGTEAVWAHYDMDVLGGAGPAPGDIFGTIAEPIGMTDYEILRLSYEIGKRGVTGLSFLAIPPGSPVIYRTITYIIMYMLAGKVQTKRAP